MKKILILFLLSFSVLYGINLGSSTTASGGGGNDGLEKSLSEADFKTGGEKYKSLIKSEKIQRKQWFDKDYEIANCQSIKQYKCPGLGSKLDQTFDKNNDYAVLIDYINPLGGEIKCSIYNKESLFDIKNVNGATPLHSQTFKYKECKKEYGITSTRNDITENDADYSELSGILDTLEIRKKELNEVKVSREEYTETGGDKFLDLADWLDALSTLDTEKIDIETTLNQWSVKLNSGWTIQPNENILDNFSTDLASIQKIYNGEADDDEINKQVDNRIKMNEKAKLVSNSQYVMYLDFFIGTSESIHEALNQVLLLFVGWNVIIGWLFNGITKRMTSGDSGQDHYNKAIFGVIAFSLMFSGSIENFSIMDSEGNTLNELTMKTTRVQTIVREMYGISNKVSDKIAEQGITSYLRNLATTSGLATPEELISYAKENKALKKEFKILKEVNTQCSKTYNTLTLKNMLLSYRTKLGTINKGTSNERDGFFDGTNMNQGLKDLFGVDTKKDITDLDFNPYPKTEREAYAMMKDEKFELKSTPYSPSVVGGIVLNNYYTLIDKNSKTIDKSSFNAPKNMYKFEACNYNKNKMIKNINRRNEIDAKIKDIADPNKHEKAMESLKSIYKIMWKNYYDLGYISIAYLPVTSMMIDQMGFLGDGEERKNMLQEQTNGGEESLMQELAVAIPMMSIFGGQNISNYISKMINSSTSFITSFVPIPGISIAWKGFKKFASSGSIDLLSMIIASNLIETMLETAATVLIIGLSIGAFVVLSLQKLWTFFATMFLVIHVFGENQKEKIQTSLAKMTATAFKNVLLVISIFLSLYSVSLLDSLEHILINGFFDNMGTFAALNNDANYENLDWSLDSAFAFIIEPVRFFLQKYAFYGLGHLGMIVIKFFLIIAIITKLPAYFYDIIDAKVNDVGDDIMNAVTSQNEKHALKGF